MPETINLEQTKLFDKNDSLRREIIGRYESAVSHYNDADDVCREDYAFALGDQWEQADRDALKDQGRPALTFNRIKSIINIISGYQRENSARIKVNPEGGEDNVFSEVMDRTIKWIDKVGKLNYKLGYLFDDGLFCGKGFMEAVIDFDNDPITGELKFKQLTPYQVKVDPDCREYDMNEGANYLVKVVRITKRRLLELYPEKRKIIEGFKKDDDSDEAMQINGESILMGKPQDDDYGNEEPRNYIESMATEDHRVLNMDMKFTVKEYWRYKMVDKYFVVDEEGIPRKYDTEEEANENKPEGRKVIKRKQKEMWVSAMAGGWILQDEKSPFEPFFSGFPFFRYLADWAPNAESEILRVQGIVRSLKDPQREKNKAKSQYLHIINTQANSGWIADDNATTAEGFKQLENMGAKPGIVIKKRPGTQLEKIQPSGVPAQHIAREEKADEEFKQISGVNPDLLGQQENTASGRAISLRIRQAVLALVRYFSNYKYTKEILGKFILDVIPMLFDAQKVVKIVGTKYMRTTVNETYPQGLSEGHIEAFMQMVKDNRYDVFVTEADQNSTIRFEIFQELSQLAQAGLPIPPELLIDYMDLPNSEEVKQKIQEYQQMQQQLALAQQASKGANNGASQRTGIPGAA